MNITYRKATDGDIDAIELIYEHVHDAEEAGTCTTGWLRDIYPVREVAEKSVARGDMYVAEAGGKVVATAIINQLQVDVYEGANWLYDAQDNEVCVLHTLAVEPSLRKEKIGTGFVEYYEKVAHELGCTVLRMDTNARNSIARHFYAGLGYREADIVPTVFNGIPGVDLVLLEKKL